MLKILKLIIQMHGKKIIGDLLKSAYSSSPFFEFYKDSLEKIFSKKVYQLLEFNFDIIN